jgi:hypothetical protein
LRLLLPCPIISLSRSSMLTLGGPGSPRRRVGLGNAFLLLLVPSGLVEFFFLLPFVVVGRTPSSLLVALDWVGLFLLLFPFVVVDRTPPFLPRRVGLGCASSSSLRRRGSRSSSLPPPRRVGLGNTHPLLRLRFAFGRHASLLGCGCLRQGTCCWVLLWGPTLRVESSSFRAVVVLLVVVVVSFEISSRAGWLLSSPVRGCHVVVDGCCVSSMGAACR